MINQIITEQKSDANLITSINVNVKVSDNLQSITDSFNVYFGNIGRSLAAIIKTSSDSHLDTVVPHYNASDLLFYPKLHVRK